MSKTKKVVRLALLGTGRMADFHAERFREVPSCQMLAAVDVDQARAEAFCKKHGIPVAYTDLEEVLARLPAAGKWQMLDGQVRHVFTHFELRLGVQRALIRKSPAPDLIWVSPDRLSDHALPTVMRKVVGLAMKP